MKSLFTISFVALSFMGCQKKSVDSGSPAPKKPAPPTSTKPVTPQEAPTPQRPANPGDPSRKDASAQGILTKIAFDALPKGKTYTYKFWHDGGTVPATASPLVGGTTDIKLNKIPNLTSKTQAKYVFRINVYENGQVFRGAKIEKILEKVGDNDITFTALTEADKNPETGPNTPDSNNTETDVNVDVQPPTLWKGKADQVGGGWSIKSE